MSGRRYKALTAGPPQKGVTKRSDIHLTEQEWKFVEAHGIGNMTARQAAIHAGYPDNSSNPLTLIARPHIAAALYEVRKVTAEQLNITRDKVYAGLMDAIDQAKIMADPMAQIAGWREVAKVAGLYDLPPPPSQLNDKQHQLLNKLKEMSDDDLTLLLAKEVPHAGCTIEAT